VGPKELKSVIESTGILLPSAATLYSLLRKHGMIEPKRVRTRAAPRPTKLRMTSAPNEVWSADYKGQFRLGSGEYCRCCGSASVSSSSGSSPATPNKMAGMNACTGR